ncbi:MAG: hypothetical protein HY791_21775 [Deltaproteobacteria bacterium]|nr:hypothetical protein [Deltaproteobacteria bacterium]
MSELVETLETDVLAAAYAAIGELWCNSLEVDQEESRAEAQALLVPLALVNEEGALALSRFLEQAPLSEEDYIDLFELEPKCPLYFGSHVFEEPKTCASASVSERNDYMIELLGVYRHFGRAPNGRELPDYVPMLIDFLSMTVDSREDPVRVKLLRDYVLPFIPPMRKRLTSLEVPYLHLLDALEKIIHHDLKHTESAKWTPTSTS